MLRQIRISRATLQQLSTVVIVSRLFCYVQTLKRFSLTKLLKHNNSNYLRERELKTVRLQVDKPHSGLNLILTLTAIQCRFLGNVIQFVFVLCSVDPEADICSDIGFLLPSRSSVSQNNPRQNLHIYNLQFILSKKENQDPTFLPPTWDRSHVRKSFGCPKSSF